MYDTVLLNAAMALTQTRARWASSLSTDDYKYVEHMVTHKAVFVEAEIVL